MKIKRISTDIIIEHLGKLKIKVKKGWAAGPTWIEKPNKEGLGVTDKFGVHDIDFEDKNSKKPVSISRAFKRGYFYETE